jgi:hypothetical protein
VASHVAPPEPTTASLQLCDGEDVLIVAPGQRQPSRVECRRTFSSCVPDAAGGHPGCRESTCRDAAEHVYEACKAPSKRNGAPVSKAYFVATCEQGRMNNTMSQCQVNCLANASCDPATLDRCFTGEDCDRARQ